MTETICAAVMRYRRVRLPESPMGWLLFMLGAACIIAGSSDSLLAKVFYDATLRKVLRIALEIAGFVLFFASVIADSSAKRK